MTFYIKGGLKMELKDYSTRELCNELEKRGGVETVYPEYNQSISEAIEQSDIEVKKGPAIVYVVVD